MGKNGNISKVNILIELECDSFGLVTNLEKLLHDIKKAGQGTSQFYAHTETELEELLSSAISKINALGLNEGTIGNLPIEPFDGWECLLTLSTRPLPPLPHIAPEPDGSTLDK
jgi:hypothetical protein